MADVVRQSYYLDGAAVRMLNEINCLDIGYMYVLLSMAITR